METKNVKEKLYLSGWGVNSYKIINKLAELVKQENGEIITRYNYYMEDLNKDFIEKYNNISSFYEPTNEKQITDIVTRLLHQVKSRKCCDIVTNRRRVNNIYNNAYHYETIKEERKKTYYII